MSYLIKYGLLGLAVVFFTSCEKEVSFDLPKDIAEKVVVEGSIELNQPPFVLLTKSFGFFSKLDLSSLQNSFLSGAEIFVSDGSRNVQLKEYSIDTLGNKFNFYTIDTSKPADLSFIGQVGTAYHLKIVYNNKTYEASTTIPQPVSFDSLWSEPFPTPIPDHPEFRRVSASYTDPVTPGNRYRYFISVNNGPFNASTFSTINDDIINGTHVTMNFYNVTSPMDTSSNLEKFAFLPGDSVVIKLSAIDKESYNFWETLEFSVGTTGNPFSTPIKVPSNISNGALGVWTGYGSSYNKVFIKD
ncbi:MAG TPA: DUF4249 domain-containing protein [Edaphocola sp.]|nr:DUF4249 domain-containing protein [Edaphocola sp.]